MAVNLADMAGVSPELPRICGHMTQRGNILADGGVEGHYRINVYLPLLDHLSSELESQFTGKCDVNPISHMNSLLLRNTNSC